MEFFIRMRDHKWYAVKVTEELRVELTSRLKEWSEKLRNKEPVEFNPAYKPDDEEVFVINDFQLEAGAQSRFESGQSAPTIGLSDLEAKGARAFAGVTLNKAGGVQRVAYISLDHSTVIDRSRMHLMFDKDTLTRTKKTSLVIPERINAVYYGGKLFFDSFLMANRVVNLTDLVREATEEEVEKFVKDKNFFSDDRPAVVAQMDGWCRKRVAMLDEIGILGKSDVNELVEYGKSFKVKLKTKTVGGKKRIVLPNSRRELKDVLRLLCDDFLGSGITNRRYKTNSKVQVSSK